VSAPGTLPRIATLMGSGELSPTMVKVHRQILERLGPRPVPSLFLGTPFGFQENARELGQRAVTYFSESLQTPLDVAAGEEGDDTLTSQLRRSRYVFSGPGSPTYALRRWEGTAVPQLLREKLAGGGAVTFASAAALTLGSHTVPVYEIYKVGAEPHWLPGLGVLGAAGLEVAVIPHYNNAEGGTHDTHFCYLGERRLAAMEELLPAETFVLGVDEHTALVIDLDERSVEVHGLGVVTVRKDGRSVTFETGSRLSLDTLIAAAFDHGSGRVAALPQAASPPDLPYAAGSASPLFDLIHEREAEFDRAVGGGDARGAAGAALTLEQELHEWSTDVPGQDELTRARASIRAMVGRLGELAVGGLRDPREVLGPFVELLIEQRRRARDERRFSDADQLRDAVSALGVELRDGPEGTEWHLTALAPDSGGEGRE